LAIEAKKKIETVLEESSGLSWETSCSIQ
jgi:hypothetical protein